MIPALVLAAGLATRFRPLSFVRAKAAAPVAGQPLIGRILQRLAASGVTDAVVNLHHLPHTITAILGDGSDIGMRVRYSWEMPVLGSAGGPRRALPILGSSTFLIVNGDTLNDVNVPALVDDHRRSGALVTIAVMPNREPDKYSGIVADDRGAMTGLAKRGSEVASYHVVGVQVMEARALATVPDDVPYGSIATLYPALIAAHPGSVRVVDCAAEFLDIGTPGDYLRTSILLAEGEAGPLYGSRARIHPTARIEDSVLWDDVEVGEGSSLKECVVTDGVHVPADTSWVGVTIRHATGELAPGERAIDGLAICSL
jgi:NDP-sugar pyrophosphorylase family protein